MKLNYIPLLVILLITTIFIGGCGETQPETQDSSNFLLSLTDLPQDGNWTVTERGESNVNDIGPGELDYNWSGGYYIHFESRDGIKLTTLKQFLSIYPEENILRVLNGEHSQDWEPLSAPSIGEHSRAFKFRWSVGGKDYEAYLINFVKNNILVELQYWGVEYTTLRSNVDYLELKELAQKAYAKIDGYGKPFEYQALKRTSQTYTNNLYGFSVVRPREWSPNGNTMYLVQFDSPLVSGKSASIYIGTLDFDISLFDDDATKEYFISEWKRDVSNFVLIEDKSMTINGRKAYSFTYAATVPTGENLAFQRVFIERDMDQVFEVLYGGASAQFETYHDVFLTTLNSFNRT